MNHQTVLLKCRLWLSRSKRLRFWISNQLPGAADLGTTLGETSDQRGVCSQLSECRLHRGTFSGSMMWSQGWEQNKEELSNTCKPRVLLGIQEPGFWLWSCICHRHPPGQAVVSWCSLGRVTALGPLFLWCVSPAQPGPGLPDISACSKQRVPGTWQLVTGALRSPRKEVRNEEISKLRFL